MPSTAPNGAPVKLTMTEDYKHMGNIITWLGSFELMEAAGARNVKSIGAKMGVFACMSGLPELRQTVTLATTGGSDYKARATPFSRAACEAVAAAGRDIASTHGYALSSTPIELFYAPTAAGGLGLENGVGTPIASDFDEQMRTLSGVTGEVAFTHSASRLFRFAVSVGWMPTPRYPTCVSALALIRDPPVAPGMQRHATLANMRSYGIRLVPTNVAATNALGAPLRPFSAEEDEVPLLLECNIHITDRQGYLGVKTVDDLHHSNGNFISYGTFQRIFGGPGVKFTAVDKRDFELLVERVSTSLHPLLRGRWDRLTSESIDIDPERSLAIRMNGPDGYSVHSILAAAVRPIAPTTVDADGSAHTCSGWSDAPFSPSGFNEWYVLTEADEWSRPTCDPSSTGRWCSQKDIDRLLDLSNSNEEERDRVAALQRASEHSTPVPATFESYLNDVGLSSAFNTARQVNDRCGHHVW